MARKKTAQKPKKKATLPTYALVFYVKEQVKGVVLRKDLPENIKKGAVCPSVPNPHDWPFDPDEESEGSEAIIVDFGSE